MDRMEIILKAYDVADEIKASEAFKSLIALKTYMDDHFKKEVDAYQKAHSRFSDIQATGGQYHPDFKEAVLALSIAKRALYEKKEVKQYIEQEKAIQKILDDLARDLANKISSHVKAPNELGFLKESSCHAG
ncbi:MAG: YlbF family regulator [Acholeplasma sp.]|nr:YlbF family regulator [Acholeplasma sp.]